MVSVESPGQLKQGNKITTNVVNRCNFWVQQSRQRPRSSLGELAALPRIASWIIGGWRVTKQPREVESNSIFWKSAFGPGIVL